ncbi:3'(2'),5'-bisphosphate nucleotidase CysQ [Sphingomonas montanisoli]|uniref:3'(2'),5'-bisphosphate nucleotidase CysQ n=1 Tax=Sphingomonas montanisoli TaxID=2606412 RepID=A0A5D9C7K3_9SPHN|nr:3'(2'),5'-bisphosphate nucleotidase CysQ [Sphingomonas montanisoli]TZG27396.1 3'(2'),5'-bisphosphate nucleotidase CysQ [Sphingomonas montanisoli]
MSALLDQIVRIAIDAGKEIMAVYDAGPCAAETKGDGSPVTEADARAEAVILAALAKISPDVPVVAEEEAAAGRIPECGGSFFLVDPLDGTKEFINRNGEFTVNIALISGDAPVAGVVYAPALGTIWAGAEGAGARMASVAGSVVGAWSDIAVRPANGRPIDVVASKSHMTDETKEFLERYKVGQLISVGSSLKFCQVAQGLADLYPRLGRTMEWDTAAGDAVLRAAGGMVKAIDGTPMRYGKRQQADDVDFANGWFVASGAAGLF